MQKFKKIDVCHGPTCGTHGAQRIKKILEDEYVKDGTQVTERLCCGRCKYNNTIVIDEQIVSKLSLQNIRQTLIEHPDETLAQAKEFEKNISKDLDDLLNSDDILMI